LRWLLGISDDHGRRGGKALLDIPSLVGCGYAGIDQAAWYAHRDRKAAEKGSFQLSYERLLPLRFIDWDAPRGRACGAQVSGLRYEAPEWNVDFAPHAFRRPALLDWLETRLDELGQIRPFLFYSEPASLIRVGYSIACRFGRSNGPECPQFVTGLILVGLGSIAIFSLRTCTACFRVAIPGQTRCKWHSVSKQNPDGKSPRISTSKSLVEASHLLRAAVANYQERFRPGLALAGILWPSTFVDDPAWVKDLMHALGDAPLVQQLLPSSFGALSPSLKLRHLQPKIDPNEWAIPLWPAKISLVQEMLCVERNIKPRRQFGLSDENIQRAATAKALIAEGKSQREIASLMCISPARLCQILSTKT